MGENVEKIKEWVRNGRCELCGGKMIIKDCLELGRMILCNSCPLMMKLDGYRERVTMLLKEPAIL